MRAAIAFLRATLIGGVMFLLPVGVVVVVAGKLFRDLAFGVAGAA